MHINAVEDATAGTYTVTINAIFQDGFTKLSAVEFTLNIEIHVEPTVIIDIFGTTVEYGQTKEAFMEY